jgi:hypothetical protein
MYAPCRTYQIYTHCKTNFSELYTLEDKFSDLNTW